MELLQLQYFCKIVENKSITKAAQEMHISQPAMSNTLKRLESNIGVPLFERKNNVLTPNDYGIQVYKTAKQILNTLEKSRRTLTSSPAIFGKLSFAFYTHSMTIANYMEQYERLNPGISFEIVSGSRLKKDISFSNVDFLLYSDTSRTTTTDQYHYVVLEDSNFYLVVPKALALFSQPEILFEDIPRQFSELPFCFMKRREDQLENIYWMFTDIGFSPHVSYLTDSLSLKLTILQQGLCLGIVPSPDMALLSKQPHLQLIRILHPRIDSRLYFISLSQLSKENFVFFIILMETGNGHIPCA